MKSEDPIESGFLLVGWIYAAGIYHTKRAATSTRTSRKGDHALCRAYHPQWRGVDQAVEESAFAHVGTTNESDKRFRHNSFYHERGQVYNTFMRCFCAPRVLRIKA